MYKLLIADDEALVREAIKEQMRWEELGFRCVADCEDGAEALERIERLRPDVVLTDICMPFVDGLELTRDISQKYPNIKVIILTGFDDFEYAQQAIKLKACDFILKPVTASELSSVFAKIKKEMDDEFKKKRDFDLLRRQLNESLPLLRERFLERLVTSPMSQTEMRERFEFFGIEWISPYFVELAMDIDDFDMDGKAATEKSKELLRFAVYNIAQEIVAEEKGAAAFRNREEKVLTILSGADPELLRERAQAIGETIKQAIATYLPLTVSIGIGYCCMSLNNILQAHQSALSALDYRFLIGKNEVISSTDCSYQVLMAQEYVKANFQDAELSLKTVCKHVSMSTSYFSTLFRSHTGTTFIEYVTHVRIERAKELLKLSQLKSYEIAYQVGFSDPHYFSLTFKKVTGDTPTEFRQKMTYGKVR